MHWKIAERASDDVLASLFMKGISRPEKLALSRPKYSSACVNQDIIELISMN